MFGFGPRAVNAVGLLMGPIHAGPKASDDGRNSNRGKPVVQYPTTPVRNKNSHLGKGGYPKWLLKNADLSVACVRQGGDRTELGLFEQD